MPRYADKNRNTVAAQVRFEVVAADVLEFDAEVVVLKHADGFYGVEEAVQERLEGAGLSSASLAIPKGKTEFMASRGHVKAAYLLVVGVGPLFEFRYREIREFAHRAMATLAVAAPATTHCAMTLHGAGYGLDEIEAFESEIAGLVDAINAQQFPGALRRISIVERDAGRARRLSKALEGLLPSGHVVTDIRAFMQEEEEVSGARLRSAGYASDGKPYVFVAMPFRKETDDTYEYGIQNAVRASGFVCERADLSVFTGDVMEWVKQRIKSASLVVADLTDANPNVYLEVGYAWGAGVPTVLLVRDQGTLKFDVRGQRCLPYDRIKDLEIALTKELSALGKGMHAQPQQRGQLRT